MFFFSSRRRHTRFKCDWSSDVCSSDLGSPQDDGNPSLVSVLSGEQRRRDCIHSARRLSAHVCPCSRSPAAPPDADDSAQGTTLDPKWHANPSLEASGLLCPPAFPSPTSPAPPDPRPP